MRKMGYLMLLPAALSFGAEDNVTTLPGITVEASRLEETLSAEQAAYGNKMEVISRQQIDEAGLDDLNGLLRRFVPGLVVTGGSGRYDYGNYSLQGSRSSDILWLVDGVRVNNRLFGTGYMDSISPVMIERIEVLKGGQGVIYGTEAVAGVINIITRSYKGKSEGQLTAGFDTLGTKTFGGFATDKIGDTDVLVFASSDESDGYQPWQDEDFHWTATDRERGYDVQNFGVKLARDFGVDTRVSLFMQHNSADLDYARPYHNVSTQNKRSQDLFTLKVDHQVSDNFTTMVKAYYHSWDTDYFRLYQYENGSVDLINNNDYWGFTDKGINTMGRYDFANGDQVLFGYEQQRYEGADEVMDFVSETEVAHGLYGQYRPYLSVLPETMLSIGVRYNKIESGEEATVFGISADHPLTDTLSLQGSAGTSFRLPTAEHLFAKEGTSGNRDLVPEKGKNANLGLTWSDQIANGTSIALNSTLFWRKVEDLIGSVKIKSYENTDGNTVNVYQYQNIDDAVTTKGLEVSGNIAFQNGWSASASSTFADVSKVDSSEQISNIPEWFATAGVFYDHPDNRWGAWTTATYLGSVKSNGSWCTKQSTSNEGKLVCDQEASEEVEYGKSTVLDIGAWYRFGLKQQHKLSARVENLLDTEHYTGVSFPPKYEGNNSGSRPSDFDAPVKTLGAPRNLQMTYTYTF